MFCFPFYNEAPLLAAQATLRLQNSSRVTEAALTPALSTALLYVMTSARAVQVFS